MPDALPYTPLPLFENRQPIGAGVRLTGTVDTPWRALAIEDEVIVVLKARVSKVTHQVDSDGGTLQRLHTLKVSEAHELPGDQGDMALIEGKDWSKKVSDAQQGRAPLEGTS
jgi:hypothetical protein